ncbi:MAG: hypothetical protein WKG07_11320 [Hymenobacter sp.]
MPIKPFFTATVRTWSGGYYPFNEWRKDGAGKLWVTLLRGHRRRPDLSSVQPDGSHTPAKNGGSSHWRPGPQSGPHDESALPGRWHWPPRGLCQPASRQPPRLVRHRNLVRASGATC